MRTRPVRYFWAMRLWRRTRFDRIFVTSLLAGCLVAACIESPERPPAAGQASSSPPLPSGSGKGSDKGDSGTDETGSSDGDAGLCAGLPLTGFLIDGLGIIGDPPVSSGGDIPSGSFTLTGVSVYVGTGLPGPTGISAKGALRFEGTTLDETYEITETGRPVTRITRTSTFKIEGTTLTTTELCPTPGTGQSRLYTLTDQVLVLTEPLSKEAFTFTRQ
jgi:hypothetical protein